MAKPKGPNEETLPAAAAPSGVGPVMDYGTMSGGGYENTSRDDFAIPLLSILQDNSPQVKRSDPKFIDGAQSGMFLNTVTNEPIDAREGVIFVPIVTQHCYVEYTPRDKGGGYRGQHALDSTVVRDAIAAATKFGEYFTKDGNELSETFYVYGYTLATPDATEPVSAFVVPFTGSKIKVYKRFMQQLRTHRVQTAPGVFKNPPLFANRLRLRSKPETNPKGSYFNFEVVPLIENDVGKSLIPPSLPDGSPHPLLSAAHAFSADVLSGKRTAAADTASAAPAADGEGGDKVFN